MREEFELDASHLGEHADHPEIPQARLRPGRASLNAIAKSTAQAFCKAPEELLVSRRDERNHARCAAMYLARKKCGYALTAIADEYGISYSGRQQRCEGI